MRINVGITSLVFDRSIESKTMFITSSFWSNLTLVILPWLNIVDRSVQNRLTLTAFLESWIVDSKLPKTHLMSSFNFRPLPSKTRFFLQYKTLLGIYYDDNDKQDMEILFLTWLHCVFVCFHPLRQNNSSFFSPKRELWVLINVLLWLLLDLVQVLDDCRSSCMLWCLKWKSKRSIQEV